MATRKKTKSTSSSDDIEDRVTRWAKQVASGEFLAGPDIRNACKRHLKDLETGHERGLTWDLAAANRPAVSACAMSKVAKALVNPH